MALNRLEKINEEVNVLMNEPVDVLWQVADVTNVHNTGEVISSYQTDGSCSCAEPFLQEKGHSKEPSLEPSLDTYIPALSESTLGFQKPLLGYSLQKSKEGLFHRLLVLKLLGLCYCS
jgi:hypothetical protein